VRLLLVVDVLVTAGGRCDWWSLGVIMFECLVGWPTFCSGALRMHVFKCTNIGAENAHDTYRKILDWRNHLMFPEDVHLSRESEDIIRRMVTASDQRLGSGPKGAEDIKRHPFFAGVDWDTIRNIEAPFVPHLKSTFDTSYFPTDDLNDIPDQPAGADIGGQKGASSAIFRCRELSLRSRFGLPGLHLPALRTWWSLKLPHQTWVGQHANDG
jgi:serine/threonine protein kinase